jgi:uncharacterized membrane protein YdjX (TVP38/TMEM64 family)
MRSMLHWARRLSSFGYRASGPHPDGRPAHSLRQTEVPDVTPLARRAAFFFVAGNVTTRMRHLLRVAILAGIILGASILAWRFGYFDLDRAEKVVAARHAAADSPLAMPIFLGVWILAVLLCLPTTVLTVLGGAVFGPVRGTLLAWSGAMLGTLIANGLARSVGRQTFTRLFGKHRLLERLRDRSDLRTLIPLRVLPIAPFGVFAYVSGIAGIPRRALLLATGLGMLPSMIGYAYAGAQLAIGLEADGPGARRAFMIAGVVTAAVSTIAVIPWIVRRLRRKASR